jgi:hypothetical protein
MPGRAGGRRTFHHNGGGPTVSDRRRGGCHPSNRPDLCLRARPPLVEDQRPRGTPCHSPGPNPSRPPGRDRTPCAEACRVRRHTVGVPLATSDRLLTVANDASATRRELGPLPWLVLEELVLHAEREEGELSSPVGVRELAMTLGISKDTAARGVRRLIEAGFVQRIVTRIGAGRFGTTRYRLVLPSGVGLTGEGVRGSEVRRAKVRPYRRAERGSPSPRSLSQLTLLSDPLAHDG